MVTKPLQVPSLTKRRITTSNMGVDRMFDELYAAVRYLLDKPERTGVIEDMIVNDGRGLVEAGFIYGRDSTGLVKAALASQTAPVPPQWLATSPASPGGVFPAREVGFAQARPESPSALGVSAAGALAWLSESAAGCVTATLPATVRFMVGRFASTHLNADGTVDLNLFIFPQSSEVL